MTTKLERLQNLSTRLEPQFNAYRRRKGETACVETLLDFLIKEERLYSCDVHVDPIRVAAANIAQKIYNQCFSYKQGFIQGGADTFSWDSSRCAQIIEELLRRGE